jgi:archaellum biogenesis ATPase FlaH
MGDFNDIFTKDATYIALFLIFISFIYFVYSYWNLSEERSRLTKRYENLKNRFKDLLVEDDIKKILRDDKEFNEELEFIDKRRKYYSLLWVILIFASLILIFSLSTFLNWKVMAIQIQSLCDYGLELWDKLHS